MTASHRSNVDTPNGPTTAQSYVTISGDTVPPVPRDSAIIILARNSGARRGGPGDTSLVWSLARFMVASGMYPDGLGIARYNRVRFRSVRLNAAGRPGVLILEYPGECGVRCEEGLYSRDGDRYERLVEDFGLELKGTEHHGLRDVDAGVAHGISTTTRHYIFDGTEYQCIGQSTAGPALDGQWVVRRGACDESD